MRKARTPGEADERPSLWWRTALGAFLWVVPLFAMPLALPAAAMQPVAVSFEADAIDLKPAVEIRQGEGSSFQVSTVPGADGIVRRIEVEATSPRATGNWAVFALANNTDEQLDRLIVADHYQLVGSGIVSPDLGARRIASITPNQGFALERQSSTEADVFLVTLDPGAVVTFVAELTSPALPQIRLWEPNAFKDSVNAFSLYRGIVLGIAGLLAVFLTILFVVKGSAMFPATALLAWVVLLYVCIDFDFWEKLGPFAPGQERIWRAGIEVALAFSLSVFLYAYLHLNRWHSLLSLGTAIWLSGLAVLGGLVLYNPEFAAGLARLSLAGTALVGLLLIAAFATQGFDRAVMLVPTWVLLCFWLLAAWMTVTGRIDNDIIQPALAGGLVLIVLLLGFTVMQHAFAGGGLGPGNVSDLERRALALLGSGDTVFDWDVGRDRIHVDPEGEATFGMPLQALNGAPRDWLPVLHPDDRDHFRLTLDTILEHRRGRIDKEFRLRNRDGQYHWIALRARPVIGSDGEVARCVGTLKDVTARKKAEDRLLHDALHDQLTGLPNRELFMDRLASLGGIAATREDVHPTIFCIDIDRFKQVNDDFGLATGDTVLLTLARRLKRLLRPQDTLARLGSDEFGLIVVSENAIAGVASYAEALSATIRAPLLLDQREIVMTASIGLTGWNSGAGAEEALKEAELAMHQAKKLGGDRIEPFRPTFRAAGNGRLQLESDLRRAFERNELHLAFQPIVSLDQEDIAGFEALMRWDHPRLGAISPAEFIPVAESTGLIVQLGHFALEEAVKRLCDWRSLPGHADLFVSVNVSSRQLIRHDLITDVESVLKRYRLPAEALKLELTESLVMDNPERSAKLLDRLRSLGVGLSLDDFGTGYSSLAYLMGFPFDTLKIDQSFLKPSDLPQRPVILHSIVTMAHDLGLKVVAEGVESESDIVQLRQLGCEFAQSFHFSHPLSVEQVRRILAAGSPDPGLRRAG